MRLFGKSFIKLLSGARMEARWYSPAYLPLILLCGILKASILAYRFTSYWAGKCVRSCAAMPASSSLDGGINGRPLIPLQIMWTMQRPQLQKDMMQSKLISLPLHRMGTVFLPKKPPVSNPRPMWIWLSAVWLLSGKPWGRM